MISRILPLALAISLVLLLPCSGGAAESISLYDFDSGPGSWRVLHANGPSTTAPNSFRDAATGDSTLVVEGTTPGTFGACLTYWNPTITEPEELKMLPPIEVPKVWPMGSEESQEECALMGRWGTFTHLRVDLRVPSEAPPKVRTIVYIRDAELNYYQHVDPVYLVPGQWRTLVLDLTASSGDWQPIDHHKPWDGYCRQEVTSWGVKATSKDSWEHASFEVRNASVQRIRETIPERNEVFNLRENTARPPLYSKFELSFNLTRTYSNPYDPSAVDVQGHFVDPDGHEESVPGFFYQGYQRTQVDGAEVLTPMGRSHWKVRYAPRKTGRYHYYLTVDDGRQLRTDVGSFLCIPDDTPGFVRMSREDSDYFEFDNGDFYYPIGHNIASVRDTRAEGMGVYISDSEGTFAYDRFLARMGRNGENFGRVWLTPWSFEIEWTKAYEPHYGGLGRYSQVNSWRLDHVVDTAREHGVYLMLLIASHGEITTYESNFQGGIDEHGRRHPEWGSPYWTYNGGPLESPDAFYTNRDVLRYYKRQVRYIAARWGYSTSVMAWEMLNEPDLHQTFRETNSTAARNFGPQCSAFLSSLFQHMGRFDPAQHLRTTNVWQHWKDHTLPVLRTEELDFYAAHMFNGNLPEFMRTSYDDIKAKTGLVTFTTEADATPFARGADLTMRYMKVPLWSSFMMPHPGAACPWWWVLIDQKDGYGQFGALAAFAEGEDRRGMGYSSVHTAVTDLAATGKRGGLRALCLGNGSRAFCWIYDEAAFSQRSVWTAGDAQAANLTIPGMKPGDYTVQVWDTDTGKVLDSTDVECADGTLTFKLPAFASDIACKAFPAVTRRTDGRVLPSAPTASEHRLPD